MHTAQSDRLHKLINYSTLLKQMTHSIAHILGSLQVLLYSVKFVKLLSFLLIYIFIHQKYWYVKTTSA